MPRVRLIARNSRFGPADFQREACGDCDIEITNIDQVSDRIIVRAGDTLCVAHARILGKYHARERVMDMMAERNIKVSVAGSDPFDLALAEARAEIHELSKLPTGRGTAKQKRNAGRPSRYPKPTCEQLERMQRWWGGILHWEDVADLVGEMLKCETPNRNWLIRKLGKRPPNPGRDRRERSDKGVPKGDGE